jgi:hypothetical protein
MSDMSWALPWNWGPAGQQYGAQAGIDANLAQNQAAQAANAAAVQQGSYAASAPTGTNNVYNSPVPFGDYSYGRVGDYPSFGEASGGGGGGGDPNATPYDQYGPSWDYALTPSEMRDYRAQHPSSGIPPDTMGGQGYGFAPYPMGGGGQQPQQSYNPDFGDRWDDSGGQIPPPVARGGAGGSQSYPWSPYFNDVVQQWPTGGSGGGDPTYGPGWNPDPLGERADQIKMGGGIGADALRDQFAWQLAQSSPYNTPSRPPSQPTVNQGYNPGMENSFANPGMSQWPSQVPQGPQIDDLQRLLEEIDRSTGRGWSGGGESFSAPPSPGGA